MLTRRGMSGRRGKRGEIGLVIWRLGRRGGFRKGIYRDVEIDPFVCGMRSHVRYTLDNRSIMAYGLAT